MAQRTAEPIDSPVVPPAIPLEFGHGVVVPNEAEVRAYLARFPEILGWLDELLVDTRRTFGESAELALVTDQPPEAQYAVLYLRVRLPDYRDIRMIELLEPLWQKFEERQATSDGWVLPLTDFCPPGWRHGTSPGGNA